MKIAYYLKTCDTCNRIMNELGIDESWVKREIKSEPISEEELDQMFQLSGTYESLFSKRSRQYRARELHLKELNEEDYRDLILDEYTFLARPVIMIDNNIFVGNSKKTVEHARQYLSEIE